MTSKNRKKNTNKSKKINDTKGSNALNNVSIKYYSSKYKNTNKIPKTQIINYMISNYNDYLNYKKLCDALDTYTLNFDECFIIQPDDFPNGLRKNQINLTLKMNPKTSLDKLISYCFYIKQPEIFTNNPNKILDILKYQVGKDVARDDRNINGKSYSQSYYTKNSSDNYKIADLFYQNIIDYLYQVNNIINLNIVNKFALLSCQNVYGLMTDMITIQINKMLEPELNTVFRPHKYVNIEINAEQLSMEFNFKSQLLITRDGGGLDPEYPCGNIDFIFFVDIRNNSYELKKFSFDYDIDKCGPDNTVSNQIQTEIKNKNDDATFRLNFKPEIVVPAAALTAGIIATPILLTTLGGKIKRRNRTIKKHKKNK
jgi:hypothetical protein